MGFDGKAIVSVCYCIPKNTFFEFHSLTTMLMDQCDRCINDTRRTIFVEGSVLMENGFKMAKKRNNI